MKTKTMNKNKTKITKNKTKTKKNKTKINKNKTKTKKTIVNEILKEWVKQTNDGYKKEMTKEII